MKKQGIALILFLSFLLFAQGQNDSLPADTVPDLSGERLPEPLEEAGGFSVRTPRAAITSHLFFLQEGNFQPELAAQTLFGEGLSDEERQDLAVKLKQIYDGEAFFVDPEDAPNESDYKDSTGRQRYRVFPAYPEIYVQKYEDQWLYSRRTVREIPNIHQSVYPYGADLLVNLLPASIGKRSFLGLELWQWLGILIFLAGSLLLHQVFYHILAWLIKRVVPVISKRVSLTLEEVYTVARPLSILIVLLLLTRLLPVLQLEIGFGKPLIAFFRILASATGIWVAMRFIDMLGIVARYLTQRTESTMDDQLLPLLTKVAKAVVIAFGAIFILQNLGINVTALLAGVSIGGLALALAAQDTVKNFIGSISIFVDRPFQVGDFIETSSFSGAVTEVGVRITRMREPGGAQVTIPNGSLANMTITNHGVRTYRRYVTSLTVTYGTSLELMPRFVEAVQKIVNEHPDTWEEGHIVQFNQMSDSSLDIYLAIYFTTTAFDEWLRARQEVLLEIMKKAEEMGISFAFPSTSVYIEQMESRK